MRRIIALALTACARAATDQCRFPPHARYKWFTSPRKYHQSPELLAFASRFDDHEITLGFDLDIFQRDRSFLKVRGASATPFASLAFYLVRGGATVRSEPLVRDASKNSLVVRFRAKAAGANETVALRATERGKAWIEISDVAVCDERGSTTHELVACTQVLAEEVERRPDHVAVWLGYHFAQGVERATIYVDAPPALSDAAFARLAKGVTGRLGVDAYGVRFVPWRFREKGGETRPIATQHCIYAHRGRARYVLATDVDEFALTRWRFVTTTKEGDGGRVARAVRKAFIGKPDVRDPDAAAMLLESAPCVLDRAANPVPLKGLADLKTPEGRGAEGPLWSAMTCGRQEAKRGRVVVDPLRVDYAARHKVATGRGRTVSWHDGRGQGVSIKRLRYHSHASAGPVTGSGPACLEHNWWMAWDRYRLNALAWNYSAALVPRPCSDGELGTSCLPSQCEPPAAAFEESHYGNRDFHTAQIIKEIGMGAG